MGPYKTLGQAAFDAGLLVLTLWDPDPNSPNRRPGKRVAALKPPTYPMPPQDASTSASGVRNADGTLVDPSKIPPAFEGERKRWWADFMGVEVANLPESFDYLTADQAPGFEQESFVVPPAWRAAHGMDPAWVPDAAGTDVTLGRFFGPLYRELQPEQIAARAGAAAAGLSQADQDLVAWRKLGGVATGYPSPEAWAAAGRPTAPLAHATEAAADHQAISTGTGAVVPLPPVPPALHPDVHAAAGAAWGVDWPLIRPALIAAGHGTLVIAPPVRQAILAAIYPRYIALAQAGLIGADGKLVR